VTNTNMVKATGLQNCSVKSLVTFVTHHSHSPSQCYTELR